MRNYNTAGFGYCEIDITPEGSVRIIGFGRDNEASRGVAQPLLAQVTVWQQASDVCCLIAIDHIGFSKQHANSG